MVTITSKQNPFVKKLRALARDARENRLQGMAILDGPHLIAAYHQARGQPEYLVVSESALRNPEVNSLIELCQRSELSVLSDSAFKEISDLVSPVGILAVIRIPVTAERSARGSCVLIDAVQDAGNVGSILRSAAAAGLRDVYLSVGCAGAWTSKVLRAAQGAHFSIRIHEHVNLSEVIEKFEGTSIATVVHGDKCIYDADLRGKVAWVLGNEGAGVSPEIIQRTSSQISIPVVDSTESLNVAAAAAICFFEEYRQKHHEAARKCNG